MTITLMKPGDKMSLELFLTICNGLDLCDKALSELVLYSLPVKCCFDPCAKYQCLVGVALLLVTHVVLFM